jgi:DNA-binding transcriptional ArsR family regulator
MDNSEQLDLAFAALANPTRRAILTHLAENAATVNQLAEPFNMSLPGISNHVKILERAGLIVRGREAQFRPCALNPGGLKTVSSWTDQCRQIWNARFNKMDQILNEVMEPKNER